jgi:hypothetical protein
MEQTVSLNVSGRKVDVRVANPAMPLLYALRNDLGLHGPRFLSGGAPSRNVKGPIQQASTSDPTGTLLSLRSENPSDGPLIVRLDRAKEGAVRGLGRVVRIICQVLTVPHLPAWPTAPPWNPPPL